MIQIRPPILTGATLDIGGGVVKRKFQDSADKGVE